MLEFYQLRNIKRQTLQSDKVRRHGITHMLGYRASIRPYSLYTKKPIYKKEKH